MAHTSAGSSRRTSSAISSDRASRNMTSGLKTHAGLYRSR
jgi:hypothetical protein